MIHGLRQFVRLFNVSATLARYGLEDLVSATHLFRPMRWFRALLPGKDVEGQRLSCSPRKPHNSNRVPPLETAKHDAKRGNQDTQAKQRTESDEEEVVRVGLRENANRQGLECILQLRRREGRDG